MREEKFCLTLTPEERSLLLESLVLLRNDQIKQGRYIDPVDEFIYMVTTARRKKVRI